MGLLHTDQGTISPQMPFALDLLSFERLLPMSTVGHIAQVRAAVDRADYADAAIRVLVRAELEISTPDDLLADVLVGVDSDAIGPFLAVARMIDSEVLLDRLQRGRFDGPFYQMDRAIYAAFVIWIRQPAEDIRTRLITVLRRFARYRTLTRRAVALLGWLTEQLNDAHLRVIYCQYQGTPGSALAKTLGEALTDRWRDDVRELLPSRTIDPLVDALPARAAPKIGRNDKCPCGSGNKYKKCCADLPAVERSPRAVRSHLEALHELAPRLDAQQLVGMERADVARLDPQRLRDDALQAALHYLTLVQDWPRVRRVLAEFAQRRGESATDSLRRQVIHQAIRYQEYDIAGELFQDLSNWNSMDIMCEITLHSARNDKGLLDLEQWANRALQGHLQPSALARAALHTMPSLGILLARGAYPRPGDHNTLAVAGLLAEVEEARDGLGLPPNDPAREMYGALGGAEEEDEVDEERDLERAGLAKEAEALRAKLDAATGRCADLARQVTELQAREPAPTTAVVPEAERLRQKQQRKDLEAMIRDRNTECAELRRRLERLASRSASTAPGSPPHPETHDAEAALAEPLVVDSKRRVLVPVFATPSRAALEEVPDDIAAAAVVLSGRLAAGDSSVWRGVKQAKDMPNQVLMARVGIHYRLLFRSDDGQLEVLDLVTRESLQMTLKRLRAS